IERGEQTPRVVVGNLDIVRDFTDVRDVVAGYVAASEGGERGSAYNVCSGIGRSVRSLLEDMVALSSVHVEIVVSADRLRVTDVAKAVGCGERLRQRTGWHPSREWRETLNDVLEDWRRRR